MTVVGVIHHHHTLCPGMCPRQAQGQIIRFGARVGQEHDRQRFGQGGRQTQRILDDVVMQITGVGIELRHLRLPGRDHARMAMPDMANVVDHVQIGLAVLVVQPDTFTSNDLERLVVRHAEGRVQQLFAQAQNIGIATLRHVAGGGAGSQAGGGGISHGLVPERCRRWHRGRLQRVRATARARLAVIRG